MDKYDASFGRHHKRLLMGDEANSDDKVVMMKAMLARMIVIIMRLRIQKDPILIVMIL